MYCVCISKIDNIHANEAITVMVASGEKEGNETGARNGGPGAFNYIIMFYSFDKKEKQI